VKVMIGWMEIAHGTVEASHNGLLYAGPDAEHVRTLVETKREWYDRADVAHLLTDDELVRSLPFRMQGWLWALFVDKQGITQEQSPYDPWGDLWRNA
jgi:hypothetical protein